MKKDQINMIAFGSKKYDNFLEFNLKVQDIYLYRLMIGKKSLTLLLTTFFIIGVLYNSPAQIPQQEELQDIDMECGFTSDFADFLAKNYSSYGFQRSDLKCAAYGGKANSKQKSTKIPIVMVHGNSDVAFGRGTSDGYVDWQTGYRALITYLGTQGYKKGDLYTTTWGVANAQGTSQVNHSKKNVQYMRAFLEAVLAYTKAQKVHVIGHSMGVTMARKIIQGGQGIDQKEGSYQVGPSLKNKVKSFIGLAGANYGLTACWNLNSIPTCSNIDGFNPGALSTSGPSKFMSSLNANPAGEGENVYTVWSKYDNVIGTQCVVWGKVTCRIPGQKAEVVKTEFSFDHFAVRDKTGPDLISWLA